MGPFLESRSELPPFVTFPERRHGDALRFLHVERISARVRKYNWELTPHRHQDLFQIFLIEEGGGEASFDVQRETFEGPTLILVPPLVVHHFSFRPRIKGLFLTIAESFVQELIALAAEPALVNLMHEPRLLPMKSDHDQWQSIQFASSVLFQHYPEGARGRSAILTGNAMTILGVLASQAEQQVLPAGFDFRQRNLYDRFRAMVEAEFRSQMPIGAYASRLNVAERTLQRACLGTAGAPPLKIIHRRIAMEAQRQLLYTGRSIAEIGYSLGFHDPASFSRFFTENVGMPPLNFRRAHSGFVTAVLRPRP